MNEHLWFLAAWIGGLCGGIWIGWEASRMKLRRDARSAAKRIIQQYAAAWLEQSVQGQKPQDN